MNEQYKKNNELKILGNGYRRAWNLLKLSRYKEAEETMRVLGGIFRVWEIKNQKSKLVN